MIEYKERDGRICSNVCCLSTNKGRTLEANEMIATFFDFRMKVERHYNRFYISTSKGQKMSDAIWIIVDQLT